MENKKLNGEEFTPEEKVLYDIVSEQIEKALKENTLSYIGPIGDGLYKIGPGTWTGKKGWEQFNKALEKEAENYLNNNDTDED